MCSDEIEAAEKAVVVAAEEADTAHDRLRKAAETLRQALNNLVKLQEKHNIPVPEWPEHEVIGHRWWAGCTTVSNSSMGVSREQSG